MFTGGRDWIARVKKHRHVDLAASAHDRMRRRRRVKIARPSRRAKSAVS